MLLSGGNVSPETIEEARRNMEQSASLTKTTIDNLINWLIRKSGSAIIAIIFILIGMKLVNIFLRFLKKSFEKSKMEASVAGFLLSVIRVAGYILVFLTAATILGIEVTSFVTILGTASLAIGLALQGALSNLAGGVLILMLKPFQVGDYIVENNHNNEGTVISIDIFYTKLRTHDNKLVVIPNGLLTNNSLLNLTDENMRKIEVKIAVSYMTNIDQVRGMLLEMIEADDVILKDQPKDVFIDSFDSSGMTIGVRVWVKTEDFWPTTWKLREQIKKTFDENGIAIPYNRLEVDLTKLN